MTLKDRITEDMQTAMRAKDSARLLTIRGLLAALKQREVDERITLDDAAVIGIIDKLVKQRKDSITQFAAGGRQDLVDKETAELQVLESYLPQRLSAEAIAAAAEAAGLVYAFLPVAPGYQSPEEIARFSELLATLPRPILAFCRSGTRSGKLYRAATGG